MLLTQEAYEIKLNELGVLEKKLREVRKEKMIAINQADGDGRHDNFGFEQAEIQERAVIKEIHDLKKTLKAVKIVESKNVENKDTVQVGSKVILELEYSENDIEMLELTLVALSNMSQNEVTLNSPIGKTIFNKKIGFEGKCKINNGSLIKVKIIKIE